MGSSKYSADVFYTAMRSHKVAGTDPMVYDSDIKSGRVDKVVHKSLDPSKLNKAGKNIRESRDSTEHPNSRAISIIFDETGSMSDNPRLFQQKLDKLMLSLTKKGYVDDPQILFGAMGDATCDSIPLQIGQYESGNELDSALGNIYLEGGGGGHNTESYELAMYYLARHTEMDCLEKRGEKGYLFIVGDELPYANVNKTQVKEIIGDSLQANISTEDILKELKEKFEVFWLIPNNSCHFTDPGVTGPLNKMFGQNFMKLENPEDICEVIVSTIGLAEGFDLKDIKTDLKDIGASADSITRASDAVAFYSDTVKAVGKKVKTVGKVPVSAGKSTVERV